MATIVDQETDARFWAQTKFKPGQKLDPSNPTDAKMIPIWVDIRSKVKREFDAGKLVTTFDHPVVAQNIADAHVADKAAAAHLDAAAKAPDAATAQQNITAAKVATDISAQKTSEAAKIQPSTVSPQLADEAAQDTRKHSFPFRKATGKDHLAHAQAQAVPKPPSGILNKETNARFWAQTGYKPGQKLDPKDPTDAKMALIWLDIFDKVKREDASGKLVLTYNHPVVAQNLADAQVADQAAAAHLDTAVAQPQAAQQNVAAATTAAQVSSQKLREAAQLQPPTASPKLAHTVSVKADPRTLAAQETNKRFWAQTGYKPGKNLDPKDPQDRRMMPIWMRLFAQVQHEHFMREAGRSLPTGRDQLAQEQAKGAGGKAASVHHQHKRNKRHKHRSTVHPGRVKDFRAFAARRAHEAAAQSRTPYVIVIQRPDGSLDQRVFKTRAELDAEYGKLAEQHDQYKHIAAFDLTSKTNAPILDSVGVPAAEHAEVPPASADAAAPGAQPETPAAQPETPAAQPETTQPAADIPPEKAKFSTGKLLAIAAAFAAVGGLALAISRKGMRSPLSSLLPSKPRPRSSARAPKVYVATPAPVGSARSVRPASAFPPPRPLRA